MPHSYDTIGIDYSNLRKPDPRFEKVISKALGTAETVVNVGAGAGSYEPAGRTVTAVEPSIEMIRQRPVSAAPVVQGYAEDLPFDDNSFDAAMAVLTVHHWKNKQRGLREMRRVSRGPVVIFTFDPQHHYWLADYVPELVELDRGQMPLMQDYQASLGPVQITPVLVPHDCTDGFLGAYWRRPQAYLDPRIRKAMSSFWMLDNVAAGLERLADDLDTGAWQRRYPQLSGLEEYDFGYRLVTAGA